jgi:muramidase (phage lysozyme)
LKRADLTAALENRNVRAFLQAIRVGEGTADGAGYWCIVGGGTFADDSHHPNVRVWLPRYGVYSTAAGAYQIVIKTWRGLVQQYGFDAFDPETQDEAAVALISGRGALQDVIAGRFKEAVGKVSAEWASLPGSTAGQRVEPLDTLLAAYQAHGGTLA